MNKDLKTIKYNEKDLLETSLFMMRDNFYRVACIDIDNNRMETVIIADSEREDAKRFEADYRKTIIEFTDERLEAEYHDRFLELMLPENMKKIFDSGEKYRDITYKRLVDGNYCWIRSELVPMPGYGENGHRVMWYVKNISAEKAKENQFSKKILQANEELQKLLKKEQEKLAIISTMGSIYIRNYYIDMSNYTARNINGMMENMDEAFDVKAEFEKYCNNCVEPDFKEQVNEFLNLDTLDERIEGHDSICIEYKIKKTGWCRGNFIPVNVDESGHLVSVMFAERVIDYEKKKELDYQKMLKDAFDAANRANSAKSEFLSRMSHDIRTPMNAIIGMTAIARTHIDDTARVSDCLSKIMTSSRHLLGLINEVLDMSRIESGKVELSEEEFNLSELIDNLLYMSKEGIVAKKHELIVNIEKVEHELVIGDSLHIQQAFMNLMGNAIKYTPEGGKIKLTISERPSHIPNVGCYEFIFEDNGIGMTPEFTKHIFEPFARAEDTRINKIQGTGLGMPITKNIINMMNGDIKIETKINEGSKFIVTIFLKFQDVEDINYEKFVNLRVLVADDMEDNCETTCELLNEMGMNSEWVLTGREAVERVEAAHAEDNDFFAVILDWKMPEMDGIATAKEIRRRIGPDIPIIIFSAYDWSDIETTARAAGADYFISKPLFKSKVAYLFNTITDEGKEVPKEENPFDEIKDKDYTGKRILLVEDNELNAEIATEILEVAGLNVDIACDGSEALDKFSYSEPGHYDLIFMDIQMPGMNGYETTNAIRILPRKDARTIPIIAMTANAFAEDVAAAKASGMNEHIAKPLDMARLNEILNTWL